VSEPPLKLEWIGLLEDFEPRPAALQMAVDEVLLRTISAPLLRVYRWAAPCITLGYFEPYALAAQSSGGREVTRRWTGGGSVEHGTDWPYSILIPATHPFAHEPAIGSYHRIHSALAACLNTLTPPATLAASSSEKISSACFENPVRHDLVQDGRKIAGAGQKRTRFGLLHQGSVQLDPQHHPEAMSFARGLAERVGVFPLPPGLTEHAWALCRTRYADPNWIAKR
jgi:lipoate-protein ligase A